MSGYNVKRIEGDKKKLAILCKPKRKPHFFENFKLQITFSKPTISKKTFALVQKKQKPNVLHAGVLNSLRSIQKLRVDFKNPSQLIRINNFMVNK
jgi:hypothetical protein